MVKTMYKAPKGSFFDGDMPMLNPKGHPMRRVFIAWRCPLSGEETMDEWQWHCLTRAAEMAAASDRPVLYYHTRAWRTNLPE